jgi:hypothetical protein
MNVLANTGAILNRLNTETLSDEEEYYIGVVRNLLQCVRKGSGSEGDLTRVELALLAAGASRLASEEGRQDCRLVIRGAQFVLSKSADNVCKIELRFEHIQQ